MAREKAEKKERQLRIGFAQTLGLSVAVANEYLRHAIMRTVDEGGGQEWPEDYTIQYIEEEFPEKAKRPRVIFATDAGKPVGCIFFGFQGNTAPWIPDDDDHERLYIDTLYVEPEYRRQGIARLLIRMAANEHSSETGPVFLISEAKNETALGLYRSLGFKMFSFMRAVSRPVNTVTELQRKLEKAKEPFGEQSVTSKEFDVCSDEFILELHGKGLQFINGGQHIFAFNEEDVIKKGMKWRRRYYGMRKSDESRQISGVMPILKILDGYKNIGVYVDGKMVGFYSLWEPLDELTYLCIFPTDDSTAANIARYIFIDSMVQLLPWRKEHNAKGSHFVVIKPAFYFSYLCLTDKEKAFLTDEGFAINGLTLLANRQTIERETSLTNEQLKKLPEDMQFCHAVATGEMPQNITEKYSLSAEDWLYLVARKKHKRDMWLAFSCKQFGRFNKDTLVTLFTAREIGKEQLFANVNPSDLTVEDWAKIIWIDDECCLDCPREIWEQFTPGIWEQIMARNTLKKWHWGTLEEWEKESCSDELKAFFKEHPEYVSKYPMGSSYRYKVSPLEIMGRTDHDKEGVVYPDMLKTLDHTNDPWLRIWRDDEEEEEEEEFV